MKRICLFLNGQFHTHPFHIHYLEKSMHDIYAKETDSQSIDFYAADGGLNYFLKQKFTSTNIKWAGDSDSLNLKSKRFLKKYPNEALHLNTMKDESDFAALLDEIAKEKFTAPIFCEVLGGLGKRRDHEYANLAEMEAFLNRLPMGGIAYFHPNIFLTTLPLEFLRSNYATFSIFGMNSKVEIDGARYSGTYQLLRPSHGLSNEMIQKKLIITPQGGLIRIYFED